MMATLTFREKLTAKASRLWESSFFPDVMRSNLLKFKKSPPKIPYKAIALATVLFLIGAFLIIIGSLLLAGYISKGILFSDNKMLLPLSLNKLLSDPMRGQTGLFLS
ncbi:transmembrane protein 230 isoform X6 [Bubalus kerabau]|uniref:transmembrane protein 230 isoform X3 n=1 Tax=Bubalus bubalis TaxID=89462 RepID=UPI000DBC4F8C|nr:transmembrane protein 230 isoform X3 [Bubalus bubalis]XP_055400205.1 transmembrane protein 230 isoform X6 [Bubalus carabanensis]